MPVWEGRQTEDSTPAEFPPRFSSLAPPPQKAAGAAIGIMASALPRLVSLACPLVSLEKAPNSGF